MSMDVLKCWGMLHTYQDMTQFEKDYIKAGMKNIEHKKKIADNRKKKKGVKNG